MQQSATMTRRIDARRTGRRSIGDAAFASLTRLAGLFVLVLLGAIILELLAGGLPAFRRFGIAFLWSAEWDPVRDVFGAAVPIYGTLVTSILALILAVPLSFGIAFYLTELAPPLVRSSVGTAIELLAAIPSIIFGMWGFFVIAPLMAQYVQPLGDRQRGRGAFDRRPVSGAALRHRPLHRRPYPGGDDHSLHRRHHARCLPDVPAVYKESAYGVGCTTWEVVRSIVVPYTRVSVIGGIMLGLGRALGETMAVTFVIGNTNRIAANLFGPGNTIASLVALEFPESEAGSLKLASLLALGFILFAISFVVLGDLSLVAPAETARLMERLCNHAQAGAIR